MADTGILYGTSADQADTGAPSWVNATNADASDGSYATATYSPGTSAFGHASDTLRTIIDARGSVSAGSTINGILLEVRAKTGAASNNLVIVIADDNDFSPQSGQISQSITTTETTYQFGSSSTFPNSVGGWTQGDLKLRIDSYVEDDGNTDTLSIDFVRVTVYYTAPVSIPQPDIEAETNLAAAIWEY